MKRVIFGIMAVAVVLTTACKKEDGIAMTMFSTRPDRVSILLAGSGNVTIDWGDGSKKETFTLSAFNTYWSAEQTYRYFYENSSPRTVTITGDDITHLGCENNELTSLDVSRNTKLVFLSCANNQLRELDVRNNTFI